MIPFRFHAAAETELNEATAFYEGKLSGLSQAFITEIERSITTIRQYPDAGAPLGPLLRKFNVRRFPYAIIYHFDNIAILILALAHQKRRPGYWHDRIPKFKVQ